MCNKIAFIDALSLQVLLVAGGDNDAWVSSTEVLYSQASRWVLATPLPRGVTGLAGVTVGGVLYMTGG